MAEKQWLHYENVCGMLVRRDDLLHWRCPDCRAEGTSEKVLRVCPKCQNQKSRNKVKK